MTTKLTKKYVLDEIEKQIAEFVRAEKVDRDAAAALTTRMFDLGARAGMPQKNVEMFVLATIRREQFKLTGKI